MRVVPVVEHVLEHVRVRARRHALEEVARLERHAITYAACSQQRGRRLEHAGPIAQDAAQVAVPHQ